MAVYTYRDLIEGALRLLGVISSAESIEGDEAANGLRVLNELIDEWNASSELLYTSIVQSIQLNGSETYTIGPQGNFQGGVRPTEVISAWIRENGIDYPLVQYTDTDYDQITNKSTPKSRPVYINFDGGSPNSIISLYPSNYSSGELFIRYLAPLSQVTFDTPVALPPAYQKALRYNLAVALSAEYGEPVPPQVELDARTSKTKIIGSNTDAPELCVAPVLAPFRIGRYADFDITRGY